MVVSEILALQIVHTANHLYEYGQFQSIYIQKSNCERFSSIFCIWHSAVFYCAVGLWLVVPVVPWLAFCLSFDIAMLKIIKIIIIINNYN